MPKLRQNIVTGDWVIIAPERSMRPLDYVQKNPKKIETDKACPFCHGGKATKDIIKSAGTEDVFVIQNGYPAFKDCGERVILEGQEFYFSTPSRGAHEVIISRHHNIPLFEMSENLLAQYIRTYRQRIKFHSENPEIEHSMIIHNCGLAAGASITHPHSQLFCSSILPPFIKKEIDGSREYWLKRGGCVFCDILREEEKTGVRIIYKNKYFIAFTFFASRFPFEIWILPYEHKDDFQDIDDHEIDALADAMKETFSKLGKKLNNPDLNFWVHSVPYRHPSKEYYHWHLEIAPRLSKYGGYELGSGIITDIVSPESAAKFLTE
ncbi:MAG: HIT domain-containing protein [Patescibacteria group bacterium]